MPPTRNREITTAIGLRAGRSLPMAVLPAGRSQIVVETTEESADLGGKIPTFRQELILEGPAPQVEILGHAAQTRRVGAIVCRVDDHLAVRELRGIEEVF